MQLSRGASTAIRAAARRAPPVALHARALSGAGLTPDGKIQSLPVVRVGPSRKRFADRFLATDLATFQDLLKYSKRCLGI